MPEGSKVHSEKQCLQCGKKLRIKSKRDITRKNFCSRLCSGKYNYEKCHLNTGMTKAQRKKQAKSLKEHWLTKKHPMLNRHHSDITKQKISLSQKQRAKKRPESFVRGEKHPNWNGGKMYERGYVLVYAKHPKANMYGQVREHVLVMEKQLGYFLKDGEVVHHINLKKDDNRPENLMVMTQSEHLKLHWRIKNDSGRLRCA